MNNNIIKKSPSEYAGLLAIQYASLTTSGFKKDLGQYMTPKKVGHFMASLFTPKGDTLKILDPGTGTGLLACSVVEYFANAKDKPKAIELVVYEIDKNVIPYLIK